MNNGMDLGVVSCILPNLFIFHALKTRGFFKKICINPLSAVYLQPPSSSDSEADNAGGRSDEEEDEEDTVAPRKADSGSEDDSDSGSEDRGRGGGMKRKPQPPKVMWCEEFWFQFQ